MNGKALTGKPGETERSQPAETSSFVKFLPLFNQDNGDHSFFSILKLVLMMDLPFLPLKGQVGS